MFKWLKYWWNRIWLFLTKWLKRTDFDNKVFSNFIDNRIHPLLVKKIKKYKGTTDYSYYKSKILSALDVVRDYVKITDKQEEILTKLLVAENNSPKFIATLICNNLKNFYDEKL